MKSIFYMILTILFEVFSTTNLKMSEGFTKLVPSVCVVLGFTACFYFMGLALRTIPLSTVYATWSGAGTALTAIVGVIVFQEHLSPMKIAALVLIIVGIVILNQSKSSAVEETPCDLEEIIPEK